MNISEFTESTKESAPPQASVYLKALWYDHKNNWNTAHELVDELEDEKGCWVHAYLHRKEGDISNADYWYTRAGRKRPAVSLNEEWGQLVTFFLNNDQ
jgi:hypothetical protein